MNDLATEEEVVEETTAAEETEEVEETPDLETQETDESEDIQEDETEEEGEEDEEQEVEEEYEFNFGGNKLAIAKNAPVEEVAENLQAYANSIEAAHTKRSQAIAETNKSLEAREAAIQKLEGLHGEMLDKYSQGLAVKRELEQLSAVNVNEMWQTDPDRARQVSDTISQKQAQLNQIIGEVDAADRQLGTARQEEILRRVEHGKAEIEKYIPNFEASHVQAVKDYVIKNHNVAKEDADQWALNPSGAIMAYKAMKFDEMQTKVKKTVKKVKPVSGKPMKPIKAKGKTQAKSLSEITDPVEYEKRWRQIQSRKS